MTVLYPTPFFGWDTVYRGPVNHFGIRSLFTELSPGVYQGGYTVRVSGNAQDWFPYSLLGDISTYVLAGDGAPGAFFAYRGRKINNRYYLIGSLFDNGFDARSVIFVSDDLIRWSHRPTSIDGVKGDGQNLRFVDIAGNDTYIVAIQETTGAVAYSTDNGETFTGRGNVGFTKNATCIAASSSRIVAAGRDGQLFYTTNPATTTWSSATSTFGSSSRILAITAGSLFVIVGDDGKIATSALTSGSSWASRSSGGTSTLEFVVYDNGRYFIGGFGGTWLTSTNGTSWTTPTDQPGAGESSRIRGGYWDGEQWVIHWGSGAYALSSNGVDWTNFPPETLGSSSFQGIIGA